MDIFKINATSFLILIMISCSAKDNQNIVSAQEKPHPIICGAEQTEAYLHKLVDKQIGVVANHTSRIGETHLVDSLLSLDINIQAIFAPEHGFRGTADAGEIIKNGKDTKTGLPVISIYGNNKKPKPEQLQGIDLMIFDIQDVGARFYTYISSMHYVMEACAEQNIPLLILDRPNPNGNIVDGPILDMDYASFVGMHPVPIAHGMTIAEYASMINGEKWLANGVQCDLQLVLCENYSHDMPYSLPVPPSPNLPNDRSIELYPSICLFEATDLSVGRGTDMQFQVIGHPELEGICDFSFTPAPNQGSKQPKHKNITCYGYDLRTNNEVFPKTDGKLNLNYLLKIYQEFPNKDDFFISASFFDKLAGGSELREQLISGKTEKQIRDSWQTELDAFIAKRESYLLYN
ncbi:MAG: DUF1343 domain-containing protein [Bacteroidales bacterium]|jgi:uncharacterized protein YbbC (DUF1343 family)|nr:DUF1343 domain-containing protein [Bacteroidales bacterium]